MLDTTGQDSCVTLESGDLTNILRRLPDDPLYPFPAGRRNDILIQRNSPGRRRHHSHRLYCPLTGGSADMGVSARNGIRLAFEEINGMAGGVNGRKLELVERDDLANRNTRRKSSRN